MEGAMKKWHIEGIISITNTARRKLVVPDSNEMYLWSTAFSHEPRRELFFIPFFRRLVSFFLRSM
jgi:hypothetical protein